ncbi:MULTISPECIES: hypothetical protein [Vibrio]|uniref:Uncharacterized protein n=1 Tax=Vibrio splendidus TaxID=29497 RepID=A0AB35MVK5_VIBSP|nr:MULTISPECIES: hypothetical protein [Vibrio]MDP2500210.1 hypothetical protein [Vibrio splendidus]MDP2592780.1 hypothetical protein [Vibrio splendidus]
MKRKKEDVDNPYMDSYPHPPDIPQEVTPLGVVEGMYNFDDASGFVA